MSAIGSDLSSAEERSCAVQTQRTLVCRASFLLVLAVSTAILLSLIFAILKLNNGVFTYTMDDPYIGLTLSSQIHDGNYGINAGVPSAPSSSILYPLLLVAASGTALHLYLPLIINVLALFATLVIIWRLFVYLRLAQDAFGIVVQATALLLLALCFNIFGVVFTGLEHNLHIAVTAACIYGLVLFLDNGKMPAWLPAVIIVAPLLRYEGLALSAGAIMVLALRRKWRTALGSFAFIVLFLGGFSAFLVRSGLPPLSSSVLTKSTVAANGISGSGMRFFTSIGLNVVSMAVHPVGLLLLVIGAVVAVRYYRELSANGWRWTPNSLMALVMVCMIGAHAAAGKFGWLYRYEDYVMVGTALIGVYLMRAKIRNVLSNKKKRLAVPCVAAVALVVICSPYIVATWQVPLESNNVYEQQFQMHRFVCDFYRAPVAVNDLGLVAYQNPNYVLDLGGLASEKARILKSSNASADDYQAFISSNGVHLVIIYDEWFPGQVPAIWVKVASMALSRKRVSFPDTQVQFYATETSTASILRPELQSFSKGLPPGVKLTIYNAAPGEN
jgi:hypothetical protein